MTVKTAMADDRGVEQDDLAVAGHPGSGFRDRTRGIFFKRMQSRGRGDVEAAFYKSIDRNSPFAAFIPEFHGVELHPTHGDLLVLADVVSGYRRPNIMDVKV